jgi:hypothetical protein
MKSGTILFDRNFQFRDSQETGKKLCIVVFDAGNVIFSFVVTTKSKGKNRETGCQPKDNPPNLYIPKGLTWFTEETWVLVNILYDLPEYVLSAKINDGTILVYDDVLTPSTLKQIFECALRSPDLDGFDKDFIRQGLASISKI